MTASVAQFTSVAGYAGVAGFRSEAGYASVGAAATAVPVTYATWNPADKGADVILSGGNLMATYGAFLQSSRSTIGKSSGKWAWENTVSVADGTLLGGIGLLAASVSEYTGQNASSWGLQPFGGGNSIVNNNAGSTFIGSNSIQAGAPYMLLLDMDAGTLGAIINGVTYSNIVAGLTGTIYAMAGNAFGGATSAVLANFGATPFASTVPSGYNAGLYS